MAQQAQYATPQEAEAAFYCAFEARDLDAMMSVWLDSDDIVCVHPMGSRLTGRAAVRESWRQIFLGDGSMRFAVAEPRYLTGASISVHHVYEDIRFGPELEERSLVVATNVYRRTEQGWRMQAHHGSPGVAVVRPAPVRPPPGPTVH